MKKSILVFFITVSALGTSYAQDASGTMKEFARTIQVDDMKAHLEFLADDLLEGRETGTRGIELAALYLKTQFQRLGLQPGVPDKQSYYQIYELRNTSVKDLELTVGKSTFTYPDDLMSFSVKDILAEWEGPLTFVGFSESLDEASLANQDVEGKVAIVISGTADGQRGDPRARRAARRKLGAVLKGKGATGLLVIQSEESYNAVKGYAGRSSMATMDGSETQFPTFYVSPAVGSALLKPAKTNVSKIRKAMANTGILPTVDLSKAKWSYSADIQQNSVFPSNVLGYLEGTDKKDEVIVFTAHYDHEGVNSRGDIYNGADDDGSGTTTILELAEAFVLAAKAGYRPRRSLLFMAVSGEEKGLLGSGFYAEHPVYPLENTVANLNIDMIGRIDPNYEGSKDSANYVYIIGSDRLSTDLHNISEEVNTAYSHIKLDYRYNAADDPNRFYERSDHYNFAKKGVPIIFYFTGVHKDYHKPTDTVEKINFNKMAKIARLIFATGWELANREDRIRIDVKN